VPNSAAPARPSASKLPERVAHATVIAASAWMVFTAVWGMFGIPGGGHLGAGGVATVAAAEQMLRWKIAYPTWEWYGATAPAQTSYATHHPYGCFYLVAPLLWVFGHRDFVIHLPAVLLNAAGPPLLYGIAKERWGVTIGAIAAAGYVVVPLMVGYSNFWGLEPVSIFGALLFFWGHSRHMVTRKHHHLLASLAGVAIACSGDWAGYLIVAPVLAWSFFRVFLLPARLSPRFRPEPYARWWALSVAIVVGTLILWLGLFYHAGALSEWMSAGTTRSAGNELPLEAVLESRKDWIDFSFTPLAIFLGKLAVPVCVLRFVILRRDEETYAPSLLFGATAQYVFFKQGADIHIFWPLYFCPYFALALALLAHTIASVAGWIARRLAPWGAETLVGATGLVVGLAPVLVMAHDGVLSLWVWRRTGGRYDDRGTLIRSQVDLLEVVHQVLVPQAPRRTRIDANVSADWYWDADWAYQGQSTRVPLPTMGAPPSSMHPFWISRGGGLSSDEQKRIARTAHVRIYGEVWVVDQREGPGLLEAYSMNEREPNPFEWLVFGGTDRMRKLGSQPDPWLTWEWRTHLGQDALRPTQQPVTLDEMRIAHNVAIASGDEVAARQWREKIEAQLDRSVHARFEAVTLVGVRLVGGVEPRIESWFQVNAPPTGDATFRVRSTLEARAPLSLIPPGKTDREMAWPPVLPTKLWRERFLYKTETVMNHRIGRERYWGQWSPRDGSWAPKRLDGPPDVTLAVVP
jgi:hypothetical protein